LASVDLGRERLQLQVLQLHGLFGSRIGLNATARLKFLKGIFGDAEHAASNADADVAETARRAQGVHDAADTPRRLAAAFTVSTSFLLWKASWLLTQ